MSSPYANLLAETVAPLFSGEEQIIYKSGQPGQVVLTGKAVFRKRPDKVEPDMGGEDASSDPKWQVLRPSLKVPDALLPSPRQGDPILIGDKTYKIRNIQPLNSGFVMLELNR
jgi:hypothetical protein